MDTIIERSCGLDVHQATIVACVLIGGPKGKVHKEIRTFSTFTRELLALKDWLQEQGITHVGMESTGVYWKPIYAVLEGHVELIVGNAQHMKQVPGRKTDVKDSEWIAQLVRHGLIRPSFVPPKPLRELRELLCYRRKLIESRTAERNRLIKLLETASIKLTSVASDAFGVSGMAMLRAIADGEAKAETLAEMAKGVLRKKLPELMLALDGRIEEHHRFLLRLQLRRLEQVDRDVAEVEMRVEEKLLPYQQQRRRLTQIPGVNTQIAAVLIAEIGVDMSVFKSADHLASWAGVCPGNDESAGKRRSGKVTKGNVALKTALVEAGLAAGRTKGTYLKDKFHRLKARRGLKRAAVAIGHKILVAAYVMLSRNVDYAELGESYLDRLDRTRTVAALRRRIERLGYDVNLVPKEASAPGPDVPSGGAAG
jgi:transposase